MRIRHRHYTPPVVERGLFDQEPPSAPVDTSERAAAAIRGECAKIRARILTFIQAQGYYGATEAEIETAVGLPGNTVRPRLWELCGNAPAGRPPRVPLIRMTATKRDGARVYVAL